MSRRSLLALACGTLGSLLLWLTLNRGPSAAHGNSSEVPQSPDSGPTTEAVSQGPPREPITREPTDWGSERGARTSLPTDSADDEPRLTLEIRVHDPSGRPCFDVDLRLRFELEDAPGLQGVTDADGTFVVERPDGCRLGYLEAMPRTATLALVRTSPGRGLPQVPTDRLDIELPWAGALQVLVTDTEGAAVVDQCVVCQTERVEGQNGYFVLARTDALGVAHFEGLAVGGWSCLAEGRRGYLHSERARSTVTRDALADASLIQEPLPAEDYISGTVAGIENAPVNEGFHLERYFLQVRGRNSLDHIEFDGSFFLELLEQEGDRIEARIEDREANLASAWFELKAGSHRNRLVPTWSPFEPSSR